MTTGYIIKKIY